MTSPNPLRKVVQISSYHHAQAHEVPSEEEFPMAHCKSLLPQLYNGVSFKREGWACQYGKIKMEEPQALLPAVTLKIEDSRTRETDLTWVRMKEKETQHQARKPQIVPSTRKVLVVWTNQAGSRGERGVKKH